jgi:hypothetical protein
VRGGASTIQHASGSDQADAGANAGNGGAAFVPPPEPGHNRRIALDQIVKLKSGGRNENEVRLSNGGDCAIGTNLNISIATDSPSIG